jgi:hypothetical protein
LVVVAVVGGEVIVTVVLEVTRGQRPEAGSVYITVYVSGALADGIMSPVIEFKDSPAGALKVPPV